MSLTLSLIGLIMEKNTEHSRKVKTNYLPAIAFLLHDFQYIEIFGS